MAWCKNPGWVAKNALLSFLVKLLVYVYYVRLPSKYPLTFLSEFYATTANTYTSTPRKCTTPSKVCDLIGSSTCVPDDA